MTATKRALINMLEKMPYDDDQPIYMQYGNEKQAISTIAGFSDYMMILNEPEKVTTLDTH